MATSADMRDRFEGAIAGLAIGDALGWPTEFLSLTEIRERYGPSGVTSFVRSGRHPAGTYTDDTQMSLAVAEALIEAGHRPLEELMTVVSRRFVTWSQSPDNDRGPGNTCTAGCERLDAGAPWRTAGVATSKGCGAAMRVAPLGLFYRTDPARLIEVAQASALPTHGHPTAGAAAAAAALLVAWAASGDDPTTYPDRLVEIISRLEGGAEVSALVRRVPSCLSQAPETVLCRGVLGEAWVADEAVAAALYCFLRSPTDYRSSVLTAVNTDGDSDTIGCIVGGISGAYNGTAGIPQDWRNGVEHSAELAEVATRLWRAAIQVGAGGAKPRAN